MALNPLPSSLKRTTPPSLNTSSPLTNSSQQVRKTETAAPEINWKNWGIGVAAGGLALYFAWPAIKDLTAAAQKFISWREAAKESFSSSEPVEAPLHWLHEKLGKPSLQDIATFAGLDLLISSGGFALLNPLRTRLWPSPQRWSLANPGLATPSDLAAATEAEKMAGKRDKWQAFALYLICSVGSMAPTSKLMPYVRGLLGGK